MIKGTNSNKHIEDKWQVEEDLRTIQRAADIQKDRQRMTKVQRLAKEQVRNLSKVIPSRKK